MQAPRPLFAALALAVPLALAATVALAASYGPVSTWTDEPELPEADHRTATSYESCRDLYALIPCDGEEGDLLAMRLVAPSPYFEVTAVSYPLVNRSLSGVDCNANLYHEVVLFKGSAKSDPASSPTELDRYAVLPEAKRGKETFRFIDITLRKPILLGPGEALYVAVERAGDVDSCPAESGEAVCPLGCFDNYDSVIESWTSGSEEAPYTWTELDVSAGGWAYEGVASMTGFRTLPK